MDDRPGCAEVREFLLEFTAGAAARERRARVARHLAKCVACRCEVDALAVLADELVTLAAPVEPPDGFESTVLARLLPRRSVWWRRLVRYVPPTGGHPRFERLR